MKCYKCVQQGHIAVGCSIRKNMKERKEEVLKKQILIILLG